MLGAWVPEKCFFKELVDEYNGTFENWKWYSDEDHTHEITGFELEALQVGSYTRIFTSSIAHDLHCLYAWRKVAIALERNLGLIDSRSVTFSHATHCTKHISQALQDKPDPLAGDIGSKWPLLFHDCVPLVALGNVD